MEVIFDKKYDKKQLNHFWTKIWPPKLTIEQWLTFLSIKCRRTSKNYHKNMVINGLKKLCLEKCITESELHNLIEMTMSPDDENKYIVLSVMKSYKKTKFKRK